MMKQMSLTLMMKEMTNKYKMKMKKLVLNLAFLFAVGASLQAQNMKIESASIYLRDGDLESAKKNIDEAAVFESTKNDRKMWYIRGKIYLTIATTPEHKSLDPMAPTKALESYLNCIRVDKAEKKRKFKDADDEFLNAVPACFNYGYENFQKGGNLIDEEKVEEGKLSLNEAVKAWDLVIQAYEFDANKQITKIYNLPKINILQYMADAAIKAGDKEKAIQLFEEVMADERPVTYAFARASLLHMENGDTAKALNVIERGRVKFPEDKDLTNLELMIYQNQGKIEELISKLSGAIEANPDEPTMWFHRANLYDNRARNLSEEFKVAVEKWSDANNKMKRASNPKDKEKWKQIATENDAKMTSLKTQIDDLDNKAIADYKKAVELNGDYFDAIFNLGAINFNRTVTLVEKANYLPGDANYEKNYEALKKQWVELYKEALIWFLKAEELKADDQTVLISIQQTYAQIGDEKKSAEYKSKREALDK